MNIEFSIARKLLERYYCALLVSGTTKKAEHLLHEVRSRLRQLEWIHTRILQLEAELVHDAENRSENGAQSRVLLLFTDTARPDCRNLRHALIPADKSDELRVLLETYYYSGHRVRDILRDNKNDLPGIDSFEAKGVRNVRNHLIEHPTKKSGVIIFSFKCGGPVGPQLKALRWSLDEEGSMDEGLHKNTYEFVSALERTLTLACTQLENK